MTHNDLLDYGLRSLIVTAAGLLALVLLRRTSAAKRHLVAACALLAVVALPALTVLRRVAPISIRVPAQIQTQAAPQSPKVSTDVAWTPAQVTASRTDPEPQPTPVDWLGLAKIVAVYVGLAFLARLGFAALALRTMRASFSRTHAFDAIVEFAAREMKLRRAPIVALSDGILVPIAFAFGRSTIALPKDAPTWSEAPLRPPP